MYSLLIGIESFQRKSYKGQRASSAFELVFTIGIVYYMFSNVERAISLGQVNEPGYMRNITHSPLDYQHIIAKHRRHMTTTLPAEH